MYDPSVGRWLEEDPIGFDGGDADLYRYVGNNPTNAVDPSGLKVVKVVNIRTGLNGHDPNSFYIYVPDDERDPLKYILNQVGPLIYSITGNERIVPLTGSEMELVKAAGSNPKDQQYAAKVLNMAGPVYPALVQFVIAGKKNKIDNSVMETIIRESRFAVFPFWFDRCFAWVETFAEKLSTALKNPKYAPLKGTGLQGYVVTWKVSAYLGLTNSHAAYKIIFPDGSTFYFDNTSLSGHRITVPKDIPSEFTDER